MTAALPPLTKIAELLGARSAAVRYSALAPDTVPVIVAYR